ncbi:MAG: hypothetical protein K2V38_00755 [Gemmataceae bacterium]|nr:hypothetical protein [Gemmataceae bacterium]
MEKRWLSCSVSPGQFPTEFAISGTQFNGNPFSLFAPALAVSAPAGAVEGAGLVEVAVIDRSDGLALVRLPAQTFENGHHVTVRETDLHARPATPAAT